MKNRYYGTFAEFENCVEQFFLNFDQYFDDLRSLLSLNSELLKQISISLCIWHKETKAGFCTK